MWAAPRKVTECYEKKSTVTVPYSHGSENYQCEKETDEGKCFNNPVVQFWKTLFVIWSVEIKYKNDLRTHLYANRIINLMVPEFVLLSYIHILFLSSILV